jgi:Nucleoside-diphosphate-sugar epimerases
MSEKKFDLAGKRIWVAGHRGMVGSAVLRRLSEMGKSQILTAERDSVDLRRQADVEHWMLHNRPDVVVVAAARVGGIKANHDRPAEFLYDNLAIEMNVIKAAHQAGVSKLLFLGSSCIYPRDANQPIKEQDLLTAPLEPTNQWYAIAKIAGIKMCQAFRRQYGCDFISAMPSNLYGPGDNFDLQSSHVLPALLRKIHEAKHTGCRTVTIWGSGTPRREFLYVDDLAEGLIFLLEHYSDEEPVNVGSGTDISIRELATVIADILEYDGEFLFDTSMPDGTPRKLMDSTRINSLGWSPRVPLIDGIQKTYAWFLKNLKH